jgi:ATP-binding cassette subfamily B protein
MEGDTLIHEVRQLAWHVSRLGELIEVLASKGRLYPELKDVPPLPEQLWGKDIEGIGLWLDSAAGKLGLEAEPIESLYSEVVQTIRDSAPVILGLPSVFNEADQMMFLAIVKGGRKRVSILCSDASIRKVSVEFIRQALCHEYEAPYSVTMDQFLAEAEVPEDRYERVRRAILREQLAAVKVSKGWMLRQSPGINLWNQIRNQKLYKPLAILFLSQFAQQGISVFSWWMIGLGVFQGHFEWAWLWAWALILFTTIPFQLLSTQAQNQLSIAASSLFKQRMLYGVLKLEPDEIRHQGAGQFLGRVMESSAVEMLAFSGGFLAIMSIIQLGWAMWVLSMGVGSWIHVISLIVWILFSFLTAWRYYRSILLWTDAYRNMTNDLVEHMVGHRTRLAQQARNHWHDDEDVRLDRYLQLTVQQANISVQLGFIPRGWMLLGTIGIALPLIIMPRAATALAVSLGGMILASQALQSFVTSVQGISSLFVSIDQVQPILKAASRPRDSQPIVLPQRINEEIGVPIKETILIAREINFRYRERSRLALRECSLEIHDGEHLLLEGPSGGGKSTLASILTGLRIPESGLLLLHGFDQKTLGREEWRRRVVAAPQFQENHVFTETFAFNLLMGRRWPPQPVDLQEAEDVCRELGLGDLLGRMPSKFQQMVGESGWQLSHGEQSRLFIARALLQNADVIVLDESFGALDPENLKLAMQCVLNRAKTLIVIAHP